MKDLRCQVLLAYSPPARNNHNECKRNIVVRYEIYMAIQ